MSAHSPVVMPVLMAYAMIVLIIESVLMWFSECFSRLAPLLDEKNHIRTEARPLVTEIPAQRTCDPHIRDDAGDGVDVVNPLREHRSEYRKRGRLVRSAEWGLQRVS